MEGSKLGVILITWMLFGVLWPATGTSASSVKTLLVLEGEVDGDGFGRTLGPAGDVNGDGFSDFLVSTIFNDGGGTDAGRTYLYLGGPGLDNVPDLILTGENAGDYFGNASIFAGDVNADGFDDFLVGAYHYSGVGSRSGRAYLYLGGATLDSTPDLVFDGEAGGDIFGCDLNTLGDINADGFDDFVIAAPWYGGRHGRAYIYFGGPGLDNVADLVIHGPAGGEFGTRTSNGGDIDGDGFHDFVIGAYKSDLGGFDSGGAWFYRGGPELDGIADLVFAGEGPIDWFGSPVNLPGDLDGDGFGDLIIAASKFSGGSDHGRVYVYLGGPTIDTTADLVITGEAPGDVAALVVGIDDANLDGFNDFLIGAQGNDEVATDAGKAYIYFGGSDLDTLPDIVLYGEEADDHFGGSVSSLGDLNGDGVPEFAVAAWGPHTAPHRGRVYVFTLAPNLVLSPNSLVTYYPCGGFYSFLLSVDGVSDLGAFEVCSGYDPSTMGFVDVVLETDFLGTADREYHLLNPIPCDPACQVSGMKIGAWSTGEEPGPTGTGPLAHIRFSRVSGGAAEDSICLEDWELVNTQVPPGTIDVSEATGASIAHRSFCYGDFNDDGDVTVWDIMQVAGRWGCCVGDECYVDTFDVNLIEPGNYCMSAPDSCIDIVDIQQVAARWGLGCPGAGLHPHFAEFDQHLRLSPEILEVTIGSPATSLDIEVEGAYDLGAFEMTISFNPAVIQVLDVDVGEFLGSTGRTSNAIDPRIDNSAGKVTFGAWSIGENPGPTGNGVLARLAVLGIECDAETEIRITEASFTYSHGWPQSISEIGAGLVRTQCVTSVAETEGSLPKTYALYHNVPNPFNPTTQIRYAVPKAGSVSVTIHDAAGRHIATIASGPHGSGYHDTLWDGKDSAGSDVSSGIYFLRMEAGDFTATRKMVLLK